MQLDNEVVEHWHVQILCHFTVVLEKVKHGENCVSTLFTSTGAATVDNLKSKAFQ